MSRLDELELERYTASFATALLAGLPLHPDELPIIGHLRGSAVFGVLLAPLAALFGPTLGVMKLLAVLWSAFAAALFALVLERAGGRRVAWFGLVAYALAPPAQAMVEVLALGSHADTLPFVLGPLALLLKGRPGDPLPIGRCVLLGLWLGAGALFSMQTWVAYLGVLAVWLRVDPIGWRSARALWIALGALPGLALIPVLTTQQKLVNRDFSDWLRVRRPASISETGEVVYETSWLVAVGELLSKGWAKFSDSTVELVRESWLYSARDLAWAGWILHVALGLAVVYALFFTRWRRLLPSRRAEQPSGRELFTLYALVHVVALLGAFSVTQFQLNLDANLDGMGSRYFMPLLPAFLGLIAIAAAALIARVPRAGALSTAALGAALFAGTASLVDLSVPGREPPVRSAEFHEFRNHIAYAGGEDRLARLQWVQRLSPDWPEFHPISFVKTFEPRHPRLLVRGQTQPTSPDVVRTELEGILKEDPRVQPFALVSLGLALACQWTDQALGQNPLAPAGDVVAHLSERFGWMTLRIPPEGLVWFARGYGRGLATLQAQLDLTRNSPGRPPSSTEPMIDVFRHLTHVHGPARAWVAEGMGAHWGMRATPYKRLNLRILDAARRGILAEDEQAFFRGFAWGYRNRFVQETYRVPHPGPNEELMTPSARAAFREALAPQSSSIATSFDPPSVSATPRD